MIVNFGDKTTEDVFNGVASKYARRIPRNVLSVCLRKFDMINSATCLEDLKVPPGNRLERLKGELAGYHSIRINDQYRIVFKMIQSNAHNVKIIDYH
ncbi:MAG: type II toxin-antitoxin system RelE/ParE family toxin [Chitinivibrionales bacterium]|nr:type II toxin-antitoxin system RelE/ParE family toxin [Chitinivibrionales bacterium]